MGIWMSMPNKISAHDFMVTSSSGASCCAEDYVVAASLCVWIGFVSSWLDLMQNDIYHDGETGSRAGISSTVV